MYIRYTIYDTSHISSSLRLFVTSSHLQYLVRQRPQYTVTRRAIHPWHNSSYSGLMSRAMAALETERRGLCTRRLWRRADSNMLLCRCSCAARRRSRAFQPRATMDAWGGEGESQYHTTKHHTASHSTTQHNTASHTQGVSSLVPSPHLPTTGDGLDEHRTDLFFQLLRPHFPLRLLLLLHRQLHTCGQRDAAEEVGTVRTTDTTRGPPPIFAVLELSPCSAAPPCTLEYTRLHQPPLIPGGAPP